MKAVSFGKIESIFQSYMFYFLEEYSKNQGGSYFLPLSLLFFTFNSINYRKSNIGPSNYIFIYVFEINNNYTFFLHWSVAFQYTYTICTDQIRVINISPSLALLHDYRLAAFSSIFTKCVLRYYKSQPIHSAS